MRAAIAGAGLMGRLIGWRLTQRGAEVTLYERASRDAPRSAAHVAAAMLAPVSELPESDRAIFDLGKRSLALWPPLLDELGVPYGMDGSLLVAHGPDAPLLEKFYRSLGPGREAEAKWVDAKGIGTLEPALAGRFERGLYLPREGWLDNRALLDALERRCGEIRFGEAAPANLSALSRGVPRAGALKQGADVTIDCRGVGASLPGLRGVRGEAIRLLAPEANLKRPVRLMHPRYQIYVAPRPGNGYVVGATQLESESTASVTLRSALELLSAAFTIHPGFAEAEIVELCTGLRPAFPDNLPRIAWHDGALCVNGLYRHGFLLAPALLEDALQALRAGAGVGTAPSASGNPVYRCAVSA